MAKKTGRLPRNTESASRKERAARAVEGGDKRAAARRHRNSASGGYLLQPDEGEAVLGGSIIIKVSPRSGATRVAMGSQRLLPQGQIPLHVHERADEILFIHRGRATGVVGDTRGALLEGATLYIPAGIWHGVENVEEDTQIVWFASPPGLDGFFREIDRATKSGTRQLTLEDVNEIARKHGDKYAPPKKRNG
jgi:quercetin dioxygenase-like cupin family protein